MGRNSYINPFPTFRPVWKPTSLSGCVLWLRSDLGVITGSGVSTWADQSGNGRDLFQATEASKPSQVLNQINGHPVIRFDGVDDFMQTSLSYDLGVSIATAFIVFKSLSWTDGDYLFDGGTSSPWSFRQAFHGTERHNFYWQGVAARIPGGNGFIIPNNDIAIVSFRIGTPGVSVMVYTNPSDTISASFSFRTPQNITLFTLGSIRDGGNYSNIDVAEVIVYNSLLLSSEHNTTYNYLGRRYLGYNIY